MYKTSHSLLGTSLFPHFRLVNNVSINILAYTLTSLNVSSVLNPRREATGLKASLLLRHTLCGQVLLPEFCYQSGFRKRHVGVCTAQCGYLRGLLFLNVLCPLRGDKRLHESGVDSRVKDPRIQEEAFQVPEREIPKPLWVQRAASGL